MHSRVCRLARKAAERDGLVLASGYCDEIKDREEIMGHKEPGDSCEEVLAKKSRRAER